MLNNGLTYDNCKILSYSKFKNLLIPRSKGNQIGSSHHTTSYHVVHGKRIGTAKGISCRGYVDSLDFEADQCKGTLCEQDIEPSRSTLRNATQSTLMLPRQCTFPMTVFIISR